MPVLIPTGIACFNVIAMLTLYTPPQIDPMPKSKDKNPVAEMAIAMAKADATLQTNGHWYVRNWKVFDHIDNKNDRPTIKLVEALKRHRGEDMFNDKPYYSSCVDQKLDQDIINKDVILKDWNKND